MAGPKSILTKPTGQEAMKPSLRGVFLRLHRDRRGLASIELVLAAPVILLIVMVVKQANLVSAKRIDTMREIRNAAFAEASGLSCSSDFRQPFPIPDLGANLPGSNQDSLSCSSQPSHEAEGDPQRTFIWDDVNKIAQEAGATDDLAGDLAEENPRLITATATRSHKFSTRRELRPITWTDTFIVDDQTLFTSAASDNAKRGYDPSLREAIRDVASGAGDLFDGIFPGAQ